MLGSRDQLVQDAWGPVSQKVVCTWEVSLPTCVVPLLQGRGRAQELKVWNGLAHAQAGHAIQEDEPARTAEVLLNFLQRFRIGQPKQAIPCPAAAGIVLPVAAGPAFAAPQR
jgi:hypothetical protein